MINQNNLLTSKNNRHFLRLLTCGGVDDGKSTLIGRLLYDSNKIYEDQITDIKKNNIHNIHSNNGIDFSLLVDGLKAEREQGITIDVAHRYCQIGQQKIIISDCPGHEEYTKNMVTAASNSDLAIVLIDAQKRCL